MLFVFSYDYEQGGQFHLSHKDEILLSMLLVACRLYILELVLPLSEIDAIPTLHCEPLYYNSMDLAYSYFVFNIHRHQISLFFNQQSELC